MTKNVCGPGALRNCTGCGICASVCHFNAIEIRESQEGFYRPVIREELCTGCALCTRVCYRFDDKLSISSQENHECYSAINKDESELKSASSGAVSIELMRECLNRGYFVAGVAYDYNNNRAVTKIAKNEQELEQFKGSKYFQSYTVDAFKQIVSDSSKQKYAIFGTPCQIYAFSKLADIKKNHDKYILVDIFCHGCPSLKLWDKYLADTKKTNGVGRFDKITFRSKTHGWHEYCFDFEKDSKRFSSSKYYDPFHEIFFGMDAMNEACYDCIARSTVAKTDIRIGDFWGPRYDLNTKGVSAVVISSEKGKDLFSAVCSKLHTEQADFEEIINAQSYKKTHNCDHDRRNRVLSMLMGNDALRVIVKRRRKMLPFKVNAKRKAKSLLKHLPNSIYLRLKTKLR